MLIDSHCHLDTFDSAELTPILDRASAAGVGEVVTIGTSMAQSAGLPALAERHANVWCTVGVHPHNVGETPVAEASAIVALASHPKVVGVGESGLDYFYDKAPRPVQQASFRAHIQAARLANGHIAMVFNESSAADATERRLSLYDDIEDESGDATPEPMPVPGQRSTFWGVPRAPMTLAISEDGGRSWPHRGPACRRGRSPG